MAEGVHARPLVGGERRQRGEDDAARPQRNRERAAGHRHADADRAGRLVAAAGDDRHAVVGARDRGDSSAGGRIAASSSSASSSGALQARAPTSNSSVPDASLTSVAFSPVNRRRT